MNRSTPKRAWLPLAALLLLAASTGCDRNPPGTALAPTGIRPAPAAWPGSITGLVFFDPVNTPDLAAPPYPPTRVELFSGSTLVATDSLAPASRTFLFTGVAAGEYSIVVRSAAFFANSLGGIRVNSLPVDAGNIRLAVNPGAFSAGMEIIGTIPGFRIADIQEGLFPIDVNGLSATALGVWDYPSLDYPNGQAIAAGTYRFKFATLFPVSVTTMTGWGDASGATLTAPVTDHPAVLASGASTDIVMTFPTTGVYSFRLDERRQTFSVMYLHAAPQRLSRPAHAARR